MCYSGNRASEMFNIMYEKGYRKVYLVNMKCDKLFSANSNKMCIRDRVRGDRVKCFGGLFLFETYNDNSGVV